MARPTRKPNDSPHPAGSGRTDPVHAFKARVAGHRRRRAFIPAGNAKELADDLLDILDLLDDNLDPRTGVELMAAFYRAQTAIFNACDDSYGWVGAVFRDDAREKFIAYASRCADKTWLVNLVFKLTEEPNDSIRDAVLQGAARYLPAPDLRALAEREWNAASVIPIAGFHEKWGRQHHLILIETIATELNDPVLYERACRALDVRLGTASCIHIAQAWLRAGDAATALQWIKRIEPGDHFMEDERERVLCAVYEQLGHRDELVALVWRRFRKSKSIHTLDALLGVIGEEGRAGAVKEALADIQRDTRFNVGDVLFLAQAGRIRDAAEVVIQRRAHVDGHDYSNLLPRAKEFESAGEPLAATVIYRALIDSILARSISKLYPYSVRYLKRLDGLAPQVADWRGVATHEEYWRELRERHRLKSSLWKLITPP